MGWGWAGESRPLWAAPAEYLGVLWPDAAPQVSVPGGQEQPWPRVGSRNRWEKPLPFHQGIVGFFREGQGGLGTPRTLVSCVGPGTQGGSGAVGTAAQFPSIN